MNFNKTFAAALTPIFIGGCMNPNYNLAKPSRNELRLKVAQEELINRTITSEPSNPAEQSIMNRRIFTIKQKLAYNCSKDTIDSEDCQRSLDEYVTK
jgi:hypothetical protein